MSLYVDHISVVVDRFGRSLRFLDLEFNKEFISDGLKFLAKLLWSC